jgi:hypothetical protein
LSLLQGMIDLCDRYFEFIKTYQAVHKAYNDYLSNSNKYEGFRIEREHQDVSDKKNEAEQRIMNCADVFIKDYKDEYNQILKGYDDRIKAINHYEMEKLTIYQDYIK